jgi:hypothetical protein
MELNGQAEPSPLGKSSIDNHITAEEIGRSGHRHTLLRAIEEGHVLGYESPDAYLASLPRNCSAGMSVAETFL